MDIHLISEARYQNLLAIIAHQNHEITRKFFGKEEV